MSMDLSQKNIGIAITGSYCTYKKVFAELEKLASTGANLYPIFNGGVRVTDRFEVLASAVGAVLVTVEQDDWMNPYKKFFIYKDVEFYQYEWRIDLDK